MKERRRTYNGEPGALDRELYSVFNPRPVINRAALADATDYYALQVGDVDDATFATALVVYLEATWEAAFQAAARDT